MGGRWLCSPSLEPSETTVPVRLIESARFSSAREAPSQVLFAAAAIAYSKATIRRFVLIVYEIRATVHGGTKPFQAMSPAETDPAHGPGLSEPVDPDGLVSLGNSLLQAGKLAEASAAYERALALQPMAPRTHNNLGVALAELRLFDRALGHYNEALRLDPGYAEAAYNLGNALRELTRHAEAVASYDRALALAPEWPQALLNRGLAFASMGQPAQAAASYRAALAVNPDYPEAHNNLGLALQLQGETREAMRHFDRAIDLAPQFANAHCNRAQLRLLLGDLESGWDEYEWRWRLAGVSLPALSIPAWDGSPVAGRTLLLRAEQGLGDTLQLVRFAAQLQAAGARPIVECQPPLASLLSRASGVEGTIRRGEAVPPAHFQIPLASLPGILQVSAIDSIPASVPYLRAEPSLVARWREKLAAVPGVKIGIAWKGSATHPQDCHRSIAPERFAALAAIPGVSLVSLQVDHHAPPELRALEAARLSHQHALTFDDSAAIVANLDLVITCDTALAHLAGALAAPVWIALPLAPDWRWLLSRDESPWYPTARLFRQTRLDDWGEVFARIAVALEQRVTGADQTGP